MNHNYFCLMCAVLMSIIASAQISQPKTPSIGTTYLSSVTWSKNSTTDYKIYDQNGNTLKDIKELATLNTDTLSVLHKPTRTIVLLPDFDSKNNYTTYNGTILKRNVGKNFYITNPYSYKTYINDVSYTTKVSNISGSYIAYIADLDKTYLEKDIRKFTAWGTKDLVYLGEAPESTFWYRDTDKKKYGVIKQGETIDYSKASSKFEDDDLIVNYDGMPKYRLVNYSNTSSFNFKPVEVIKNAIPTTGCLKGDCYNGWGKWQYNNGYYEGFWSNSKKQGYGLYNWSESGKYIGEWNNDNMSGYGVYIAENNDNIKGEYENGNLNGLGVTVTGDKWKQGIFSNGSIQTAYNFYSTDKTTGCTAGNCQDKYGRYKWNNGDSFTGFFKNGNMYMGTYTFSDGDKYSGQFNSSNQYNGMGRFFFKDGSYYGGSWKNGKYHGLGYFHNKNLERKLGKWENGYLKETYQ